MIEKNRSRELASRRLINRTRIASRWDLRFSRLGLTSLDPEGSPGIFLSVVTALYFPALFELRISGPLTVCSTGICTDQLEGIFPGRRVATK